MAVKSVEKPNKDDLLKELDDTKAALKDALKRIKELEGERVGNLQQSLSQRVKSITPELLTTNELVGIIAERNIPKWDGKEDIIKFYNRVWKLLVDERIAYLDVIKEYDLRFARRLKNYCYLEDKKTSQYFPPKSARGDKVVEVLGKKSITRIACIHRSRYIGRNSKKK